jgi:hypothetical protein
MVKCMAPSADLFVTLQIAFVNYLESGYNHTLTATHSFSISSGLVLTAASALKNQQSPS